MPCEQREKIEHIDTRLGVGDVNLATMNQTLVRIEEQVTKTNGRVTKLEKLRTAILWLIIGVGVASSDGPTIIRTIMSAIGK